MSLLARLAMDSAYDTDAFVIELVKAVQGNAVILFKFHRMPPREFDKALYRLWCLLESFFAKIKQFYVIANRYDKLARHFLRAIHLASGIV